MVAAKVPQILQLNPSSEIVFEGPFEHVVTSFLELKNPSEKRVFFKVKTTAPRRYCVRPNCGLIEPNRNVKIAIMLQPMEPGSQAERSKHKFMVQSTVDPEDGSTVDEVWASVKPDCVMDSKLRCAFQTPDEATNGDQDNNEETRAKATAPQQQQQARQQKAESGERQRANDSSVEQQVSAAMARITSSTPKATFSSTPQGVARSQPDTTSQQRTTRKSDVYQAASAMDKSVASSHNLTASFLQPMGDDYKIVLVSLAMLFLGVILGRYII